MSYPLLKDLDELINKNIISADAAKQIELFYENKKNNSSGKFPVALAILGALLLGTGIILVIAHNWDMLSRPGRTVIAFIPLIAGQALCLYTLIKKSQDRTWIEVSSTLLFFGVATCISLIAQIYHVNGTLPGFLYTWILTTLPLVYIMRSSVVSLLIIALATWYAALSGYSGSSGSIGIPYQYLGIMLLLFPHYYNYLKHSSSSIFFYLHNWFIAISVSIALGTFINKGYDHFEWVFIGYIALAGAFYLLGNLSPFKNQRLFANPFRVIGSLSTIILFLIWTFKQLWFEIKLTPPGFQDYQQSFTWITIALILFCAYLFIIQFRKQVPRNLDIPALSPFIFTAGILLLPPYPEAGILLFNLWVMAIGIFYIRKGAAIDHLGILNFGLLVIASLALIRFFDSSIPFVWRGLIFIATGAGFFISNSMIMKKRKANIKKSVS